LLIRKKNKKPIRRIGKIENRKEINSDWEGTLTFQPLGGGLPVRESIIVGS
jgi:hypothetical protein